MPILYFIRDFVSELLRVSTWDILSLAIVMCMILFVLARIKQKIIKIILKILIVIFLLRLGSYGATYFLMHLIDWLNSV